MAQRLDLQHWLDESLAALASLAQTSLGYAEYAAAKPIHSVPTRRLGGAYIPVFLEKEDLVIGILSDPLGCEDLTRGFLGAGPASLMPREDVVDVMKELINMLAGLLKRQMRMKDPILSTSMPIFIDGMITPTPRQELIAAPIATGGVLLYLAILREQVITAPKEEELGTYFEEKISGNVWMEELVGAASNLGEAFFSRGKPERSGRPETIPEDQLLGVYVPLVGDQFGILIGLISNRGGFKEAAVEFLGIHVDELTEDQQVVDAMKEILNIVSGILKQQMAGHQIALRRGLPLFVEGWLDAGKEQESWVVELKGSTNPLYLTILRKQPDIQAIDIVED